MSLSIDLVIARSRLVPAQLGRPFAVPVAAWKVGTFVTFVMLPADQTGTTLTVRTGRGSWTYNGQSFHPPSLRAANGSGNFFVRTGLRYFAGWAKSLE
jgi:hypothetical protein